MGSTRSIQESPSEAVTLQLQGMQHIGDETATVTV